MFERLPMKGPIFAYGAIALALAGVGQLARSRADQVGALLGVAADGGAGGLALEATTLNSAALDALSLPNEATLADVAAGALDPTGTAPTGAEPARREPRLHAPFVDDSAGAPLPTPRNVIVRLRDAAGAPLVASRVDVELSGDGGRATPNAYLFTDDATQWTIGCAALTRGQRARFELRAHTAAGTLAATAHLAEVPPDGDIDLGDVRFVE